MKNDHQNEMSSQQLTEGESDATDIHNHNMNNNINNNGNMFMTGV